MHIHKNVEDLLLSNVTSYVTSCHLIACMPHAFTMYLVTAMSTTGVKTSLSHKDIHVPSHPGPFPAKPVREELLISNKHHEYHYTNRCDLAPQM